MKRLKLKYVDVFLDKRFVEFYNSKINFLDKMLFSTLFRVNFNPYLMLIRNELLASELIRNRLNVYLFELEDKLLNNLLIDLAIFICERVYNGRKSSAEGIDLEFKKDKTTYIVSIKSGPNWGNSEAVKKMISNFNSARKILRTSNSKINVIAVNGCCYGRNNKPYREKGDYFKYCGQQFWEFISGNENLYTEIIEPLGHKAKERNEEFMVAYAQIINKFTLDFMKEFCIDGKVDWEKLVKFNSEKKK